MVFYFRLKSANRAAHSSHDGGSINTWYADHARLGELRARRRAKEAEATIKSDGPEKTNKETNGPTN